MRIIPTKHRRPEPSHADPADDGNIFNIRRKYDEAGHGTHVFLSPAFGWLILVCDRPSGHLYLVNQCGYVLTPTQAKAAFGLKEPKK